MLICVYDKWFDPTGIRLEYCKPDYRYFENGATRIIFGEFSKKNPRFPGHDCPEPEYIPGYNCIIIEGKLESEVANEINYQINIMNVRG